MSVVQPLSKILGAPQSDGQPSLLRSLLTRACSVPMIFEDPVSVRRLTLFVHETRLPCTPYFVNFAAALQALDGPTSHQPVSPVLAGMVSHLEFSRVVHAVVPSEICHVDDFAASH